MKNKKLKEGLVTKMKKNEKRILSFILAVVMIFALMPVIGNPMVVKAEDTPAEHVAHDSKDTDGSCHHDTDGWVKITTYNELSDLLTHGGNGYLNNNIELTGDVFIRSGVKVNLCLNGFCLNIKKGGCIRVSGIFNLFDIADNSGKMISVVTETDACVVMIENGGTFNMNGGTIANNNYSIPYDYYGNCGGVYVLSGNFTMNGGIISNNTGYYTGGVFVENGNFTMNGGIISNNTGLTGGGVIVENGNFIMNNGIIKGNTSLTTNFRGNGGGVFIKNKGNFTMNGGTVSGNGADYGGGVYNKGTFTMNGGKIEGNGTTFDGGGVFNWGTFTMTEGTIEGNNAIWGGGVYNEETFTMTGGTIEENNADIGGGVANYETFTMIKGAIKENKASVEGNGVYSSKPFVKEGGEINGSIESLVGTMRTVTFNANDGSGKTIIQYVNPNEDINLAPNKFSYGNYIFGCWNTMADGTGDPYQDKAKTIINSDLVLYARWIESYDVTFNVDNGSWADGTNDDKVVNILKYIDENKELKLNASAIPSINPVNGYKGSWDTEPDTENALTENKTYTYTFEPIEYTVEYDPNGGAGTMDNQSRAYDDKATLTANAFKLEGYTFTGWNTVADGSGTSYADEEVNNLSSTDGDTVKLFAQWQANNYTVKFDPNGGDGRMEDQGRTYDDKAPLTANTFTFEGKTFNGWNTVADGSGTSYADEEVNNLSSTEGDIVTLYAQWTTNTYTVSWKDYDGTVLETDTDVAYGSTPSYDGETPIKEKEGNKEYTFSGWTPAIDIVKGAATYTATYSENEIIYTVTFDANGGKADTTIGTTNAEFKLSSLPTPTYEGYTFKGWFTEATGGSEISADTVYTQDTTIYAQWEKVEEPEEPTTPEELKEPEEPTTPEEPTEPEVPVITEPEPEVEIPEKDWLDDLRLKLQIANELGGPQTVEYSGDFALSYDIMQYLVEHPDITFVYHVTYEGQEYIITIPAGKAVAYADTPWYGPLWLLANYGGNNAPTGATGTGKYIVKAGDTLTGISVKLGVTIQYLVDKNNIKNANVITVGQLLEY